MSTTFGILKFGEDIKLVNDELPANISPDDFYKVAFRTNDGFNWLNSIAPMLPDSMKVYPLDNTAQGIYTIGDVKEEIKKQLSVLKDINTGTI